MSTDHAHAHAHAVLAAVQSSLDAAKKGDAKAFADELMSDHTEFDLTGALLFELSTRGGPEGLVGRLQAAFEAGYKLDLNLRHGQVRIHGDTALVTGYLSGRVTQPSGQTVQGQWRFSELRQLHNGKWKAVHSHFSPIRAAC